MPNENVDAKILLPILKQIPLFSGLDEKTNLEIIARIILMYYPPNYELFKEGDFGDALYIVKRGTVEIYHPPKEEGLSPREVAKITDGGFFGEMALVTEEPRNAAAKTLTDCEIFILSKEDFVKLLSENTTLAEHVSTTVVVRTNKNQQNT